MAFRFHYLACAICVGLFTAITSPLTALAGEKNEGYLTYKTFKWKYNQKSSNYNIADVDCKPDPKTRYGTHQLLIKPQYEKRSKNTPKRFFLVFKLRTPGTNAMFKHMDKLNAHAGRPIKRQFVTVRSERGIQYYVCQLYERFGKN